MNSSSSSRGTSTECEVVIFLGGRLGHATVEAYALLVFVIILNIITCPITVVLNALVMHAVKTKPRLKTKSNVVLDHRFSDHRLSNGSDRPTSSYRVDNGSPTRRGFQGELFGNGTVKTHCKGVSCNITSACGLDECGALHSHQTTVRLHHHGHPISYTSIVCSRVDRNIFSKRTFSHHRQQHLLNS